MHPCLNVDEILRLLACELVASEAKGTAVSLACCCKSFEDPVLDALWESQDRLTPLLKCLPREVWKEGGSFTFKRIPTKAEWCIFQKYARRVQGLVVDASEDPVTLDFLFALQSRATNEPFLPKLRDFECGRAAPASIPLIHLIPSFLSRRTTGIYIRFEGGSPTAVVASVIIRLPMLCPDLERITLESLPRDPVITEAVSDMLLACNRDTLQWFCVDSPLTEEAREVVFQLPDLTDLWVVIQGRTLLPSVALPNLITIDVEYGDHLDWLQGFRGATLKNLEDVHFASRSWQIGDFLGEFKSVALAASATLSKFSFRTSQPWDPTYRSLLPFTQLEDLQIEFSCNNHCSSRLDDNIIIDLARAMPKLKILKLGGAPCGAGGDVTVKGLIALASGCCHLSKLRIHFQTESLVEAAAGAEVPALSSGETVVRRQDCALTDLEVGKNPIQEGTADMVAMALLQIFPRLLNIEFIEGGWENVMEIIRLTRRFSTFVQHTSNALGIRDVRE